MNVSAGDFVPFNKWTVDVEGRHYFGSSQRKGEPMFIIDETTKRKYFNESPVIVGFKCFMLTMATPFVHPLASIINIAYRFLKIATLSHFWGCDSLQAGLVEAGKDMLRIVAMPLSLVGLQLAAIYGMVRPYDGRKLYATMERATYGYFIIAPCFQPDPHLHFFGGDVNRRNAF